VLNKQLAYGLKLTEKPL